MKYIHFVGGFAKHKGKDLSLLDLTAISFARQVYPEATILAWTLNSSWPNLPAYCNKQLVPEQVCSNWPNFKISHGEHMSDKVRLYALLLYGGLYIDTDVLCLRPLPVQEKLIVAKQSRNSKSQLINNGIIYAPEPYNKALMCYLAKYLKAKTMGAWDLLSCRNLYSACMEFEHICDIRRYKQFHGTGWPVKQLETLPSHIDSAYFWHLIGQDKQLNSKLILDYASAKLGLCY